MPWLICQGQDWYFNLLVLCRYETRTSRLWETLRKDRIYIKGDLYLGTGGILYPAETSRWVNVIRNNCYLFFVDNSVIETRFSEATKLEKKLETVAD